MKKLISLLLAAVMCISLCSVLTPSVIASSAIVSAGHDQFLTLGHYEQDNNLSNGKEPIVWKVMEINGDEALILSNYALDERPFDDYADETTWDKCTLRTWLNSTFLENAFDDEEQKVIIESYVKCYRNSGYSYSSGSDTIDKIFLPSAKELPAGRDIDRVCIATEYLKSQPGMWYDKESGQVWYYLRTVGMNDSRVALIHWEGSVFWRGDKINNCSHAIRPMMRISISALEAHNGSINTDSSNVSNNTCPFDMTGQYKGLEIPGDITWLDGTDTKYVGRGSYMRISWHVFDDGKDHCLGVTSKSKREEVTLLGKYRDLSGTTMYLVKNSKNTWFWVTADRLNNSKS